MLHDRAGGGQCWNSEGNRQTAYVGDLTTRLLGAQLVVVTHAA